MNHIIIRDTCHNMRKGAREALSGAWGEAVKATLIYLAVTVIPSILAGFLFDEEFANIVTNVYMLVVGGPFTLGYSLFMLRLFRKQPATPTDVFSGFETFGKAFVLYLLIAIFVILWSLLLIIPGIIASYRYRLAYFVMVDNPHLSPLEAIGESKRLMTGNKGKLFLLDLSFIGWAILGALTVGLGYIFLCPYFTAANIVFYEIANGNLTAKTPQITYGRDSDEAVEEQAGDMEAADTSEDKEVEDKSDDIKSEA